MTASPPPSAAPGRACDRAAPFVVVLCGPTAAGKTAVGIRLARELDGEIVSADALQVYRRLNLGTAKPTPEERALVAHHLIDVVEPDEPFDAARYVALARPAVADILRRGKIPLVVGGTGLYIRALLHGLFPAPAVDPAVRVRLAAELTARGAEALHARLAQCDPETARRLHPRDTARILRALEVFEATGRPISVLQRAHRFADSPYASRVFGLRLERAALYARIDRRVEEMLAAGLEDEVRGLLAAGFSPALKPMQALGYRHIVAWLEGRIPREEAVRTMKRDTRRYAKRQLTWFRATPGIRWFSPEDLPAILAACREFLASLRPSRPHPQA
ncbi:MAG: tRNA (adenosine(37)-N6)-dimethylallyltransferase MiaA [Desulfobacterales bacterium]